MNRVLRWMSTASLLFAGAATAFDGSHVLIPGGKWDVSGGPIFVVIDPDGSDDIDSPTSEAEAIRFSLNAWACNEGTPLKFEVQDTPGPKELNLADGLNTFFWDETGDLCQMGPGTLGIAAGDAGGTIRSNADVCFNGRDSAWRNGTDGTGTTDVISIAMHEIGHFIGLDHPCDKEGGGEVNCNGPERSVMTPAWSGADEREIRPDDLAGLYALYPDDGSGRTCTGPFGQGERCTCTGECINDLLCVDDGSGVPRCSKTCTATAVVDENGQVSGGSNCGPGASCVLSPAAEGEASVGICITTTASELPAGAVCRADNDCQAGVSCEANFDIGASLCSKACGTNEDCGPASVCSEGICLGDFGGIDCPPPPGSGPCGCGQTNPQTPWMSALVAGLAVVFARRRSRRF
jgi:uncharacterized protein (TIGR03382 family)